MINLTNAEVTRDVEGNTNITATEITDTAKGGYATLRTPKYSDWQCYMYGSKPGSALSTVYRPIEENLPNRFVRFMMKVCLGCTWVKDSTIQPDEPWPRPGV